MPRTAGRVEEAVMSMRVCILESPAMSGRAAGAGLLRGSGWKEGGELADSGDQFIDTVVKAVAFGAGLLGKLFDAGFQAAVGFAELVSHLHHPGAELVDLPLSVAPELAICLAVLPVLFGESSGDVFDALGAFFGGHGSFLWLERGGVCLPPPL
jgi:hypothetical protein